MIRISPYVPQVNNTPLPCADLKAINICLKTFANDTAKGMDYICLMIELRFMSAAMSIPVEQTLEADLRTYSESYVPLYAPF